MSKNRYPIRNKNIFFFIFCLVILGSCQKPYQGIILEKTIVRKYPFSGIGLVRGNTTDSVKISYSYATPKQGVNEVRTATFATDTVVGYQESWVKIDIGKKFGGVEHAFSPDYTPKGGQYFEVCNQGKSNLFYFIVPNPKTSETQYRFEDTVKFKYGQIPNIVTQNDSSIHELLYHNGIYAKHKLKHVAELFKKHDKTGKTLLEIYMGESIHDKKYKNDPESLFGLNRSSTPYANADDTEKSNGKGFYYGIIYSGECLQGSEQTGGIMLQRVGYFCYKQNGCRHEED